MIAREQKIKLAQKVIKDIMLGGKVAYLSTVIPMVNSLLKGKRLGAPLFNPRAVVIGQPIGGPKGTDISTTFTEMREDLLLLYSALIELAARNVDLYAVFAIRRDKLTAKIRQLKIDIQTLLAQSSAASRTSVTESFHTLDNVDLLQTTAIINLTEGNASLPPNTSNSIKYNGDKVRLVKSILPPGGVQPGPSFQNVFSPFRLDSWYASLPAGSVYEAHVNITGADYEKSNAEEVLVNAISIQPTGPLHIEVTWSPDGQNWYPLSPEAKGAITDTHTFHFTPVSLGFLNLKISNSESVAPRRHTRFVGIKRIEILRRGYNNTASLYSNDYTFTETINTVVAEIQADTPIGTKIASYLSLTPNGPWTQIQEGPVTFDTQVWQDLSISSVFAEQEGVPQTMWRFPLPDTQLPQPNTGELIAGRGQIQISAYPFDWKLMGDPYHIPDTIDWQKPLGEIRTRTFTPVSGITTTNFSDNNNPISTDLTNDSYMIAAIIDANGKYILQKGYNYRITTHVWVPVPTTLQNQQIGIINTGGTANVKVSPVSVYVNGVKVYQNQSAATSISDLSNPQYQASIPLSQGFNEIQILLQIPTTTQTGTAANNIFLYFQPNLFNTNLQDNLGISYIQAYRDPWKRVSEFSLRYNTPPAVRDVWAWDEELAGIPDGGPPKILYALFNHDITNTAPSGSISTQSFQTIDGQNFGVVTNLNIRYPADRNLPTPTETLYFRADLSQDTVAPGPPRIHSYRLIVN